MEEMASGLERTGAKIRAVGIAVVLTFALLVSATISNFVTFSIIEGFGYRTDESSTRVFFVSTIVSQVGFLLIARTYLRWSGRSSVGFRVPDTDRLDRFTVGLFALVVAVASSVAISNPSNVLRSRFFETLVVRGPTTALTVGVVMGLIAPPIEEYVFRGVIQRRLRSEFSGSSAVLVTTLLFWSLHFGDYGGAGATLVGLSAVFVASMVYGLLYERTGSLRVPTLAHSVYNSIIYWAFSRTCCSIVKKQFLPLRACRLNNQEQSSEESDYFRITASDGFATSVDYINGKLKVFVVYSK